MCEGESQTVFYCSAGFKGLQKNRQLCVHNEEKRELDRRILSLTLSLSLFVCLFSQQFLEVNCFMGLLECGDAVSKHAEHVVFKVVELTLGYNSWH